MAKKPNIRFAGFEDDWEQRKVGDITKELSEYAKLNSGLPLLTSARTGLMYQSDYRGNSTTDNENTLFSIVPLNACTYRHMSDDSTFHINVNTLEKGLVSKEYPVFVENESDLRFVVQYINSSDSFTKFCTEQKKGGTRTRLYYKTLCEYKMLIPSLNEQHIIADYFDNLDHLITLHQRKCDELKKVKKFMLQKMFPKKGEKNPEIRFDGFTNDWEQRKVGDYLTESREIGNNGDVARKMTVKLWGKGVYEKLEAGSTNTQYFIRHANQFIYSKLDFLNCAFGVVPEELESLETTADVPAFDCVYMNPYFMFYRAIQPSFYIQNGIIANGSRKAKRIHTDTFLEMPISVPCLTEQNKIVGYFQSLDHLITLHQRKCEELKNVKKYMLQNMFAKGE